MTPHHDHPLGPRETATIVLESSGIGLDPARALRSAGLDGLRVHLPGWGRDYERVTRVPGSFRQARAGLEAALAAARSSTAAPGFPNRISPGIQPWRRLRSRID